MTPITRNADLYLPLRPGIDLALLMVMLHVIVRENLVDDDFVARHTTGWEAVRDSAQHWDPRRAAEITGIPPERIEQAALMFGRAPAKSSGFLHGVVARVRALCATNGSLKFCAKVG